MGCVIVIVVAVVVVAAVHLVIGDARAFPPPPNDGLLPPIVVSVEDPLRVGDLVPPRSGEGRAGEREEVDVSRRERFRDPSVCKVSTISGPRTSVPVVGVGGELRREGGEG